MRAAVYLRVSAEDRGPSKERREALAFVNARGWNLVETYADAERPAGAGQRPELARMIRDGWSARFEVIVAWDLSRLVRSDGHFTGLLRRLSQMRVRLVGIRQGFDTESQLGEASLTLANMLGKIGRSNRGERVREGMGRARAAGKRIGRPAREVDLDELQRLRAEGKSIRQIARATGVPSSTVGKRLRLPTGTAPDAGHRTEGAANA